MDREQLRPRQQQVLALIEANPATTLQDLGDEVGVTRERIRQIMTKLRSQGFDVPVLREARNAAIRVVRAAERETQYQIRQTICKLRRNRRRRGMYFRARLARDGIVRNYNMPGSSSICGYQNCTRPIQARGFCALHYFKLRAEGVLWVARRTVAHCTKEGCGDTSYARGLCRRHYGAYIRKNPSTSNVPAHNTSGYRGVSWNDAAHRWYAHIRENERMVSLGTYNRPEEAALAYDAAARRVFGNKAKLNFPDNTDSMTMREHQPSNQILSSSPNRVSSPKQIEQGVFWDEQRKRWRACFKVRSEEIYSGYFMDKVLATRAYDDAVARHHKQKKMDARKSTT